MQDFEWAYITFFFVREYFEKKLGCFRYRVYGARGMHVSEDCEVGDGFQVIKVWACENEEVSQHLIGVPVGGKVREAVEYVVAAAACCFYYIVNGGDESLKARFRVDDMYICAIVIGKKRFMIGESEIYQFLS